MLKGCLLPFNLYNFAGLTYYSKYEQSSNAEA